MIKGAAFSDDQKYRYLLYRIWEKDMPRAMCIGLNPSTANQDHDDATITRLITTLKSLGYGGLYMTNLFGLVSSDPELLREVPDPVGANDTWLKIIADLSDEVIFCWGAFPMAEYRAKKIRNQFTKAKCFGKNSNGTPWHPLAMMYAGMKGTEGQLIDFR
jgi:hypothetical protein